MAHATNMMILLGIIIGAIPAYKIGLSFGYQRAMKELRDKDSK